MTPAIRALGGVMASLAATTVCVGQPPAAPARSATGHENLVRVNLSEVVEPQFRDAVMKCVRNPTISTQARGEEVVCTVAVYEWLFDHPDRVSLAWQRLNVPAVAIGDLGNGKFSWTDENGSVVVWQTVGRFADGRVWYATGRVKPIPAGPTIPVQGVIIVTYPRKAEKDGVAVFAPTAQAYMHSDSRAANLILRAIGPAAPKLAEEAAGQLLEFFGGIADYVQRNPKKAAALLAPKD